MPFKESCPVEERIAMLRGYDTGAFTVAELCRHYGISRETFYVWKRRRESGDPRWFDERSRAPDRCPHTTPADVIAAIAAMRRRRRPWPQGEIVAGASEPNGEWSIDFKGWFRTRDGTRCDPLTVEDTVTRYLIAARVVEPTGVGVRRALERIFNDVGLPNAMRSDNGPPFGSVGAGGLSRLSVWWLKLGIEPRYIPPSAPQENGRHERMHRTLKDDTAQPPAATVREQQARFDAFRERYNEERPHEALGQTPPASHWRPSARPFPQRLEEPWYDADHEVRRVRPTGEIKWRGELVFIGEALAGELVGLAELEGGGHMARFCGRELGVVGRDLRFHRFAPPRARLRCAVETEEE